jgi:hypothetical protein
LAQVEKSLRKDRIVPELICTTRKKKRFIYEAQALVFTIGIFTIYIFTVDVFTIDSCNVVFVAACRERVCPWRKETREKLARMRREASSGRASRRAGYGAGEDEPVGYGV